MKIGTAGKTAIVIFGILLLFVTILFLNLIISAKYEAGVTKGLPIENYSESRPSLLVIDIQESTTGDLSSYPYFRENSGELIRNINRLIEGFSSRNLPVIHIRSEISNPLINLLNNSYAKGSPGAQFDKRIRTSTGIEVVKRAKDSFKNTTLDSILTGNRINELYIVGLDAAECVNATVEAAQNRNYRVYVIRDAILSKSAEKRDSMIICFKERGVKILDIEKIPILE